MGSRDTACGTAPCVGCRAIASRSILRPDACANRLFVGSTNGLASGNTHDEAILHALCEIIESRPAGILARAQGILARRASEPAAARFGDRPELPLAS
jgi:YcaO-like protein with predicted kinase domain